MLNIDIPLGFLFNPTDEELVSHYLYNKIHGLSLSIEGFIEEMDVYRHEPWLLPHKNHPILQDNEWYYFVRRTKVSQTHCGGKNPRRALQGDINGGWWKANGGDKAVTAEGGRIIGYKKTLTFFSHKKRNGNRKEADKTDWIMHEYRLVSDSFQDFVLCRIHYKSKGVFDRRSAKPFASQTNNKQNGFNFNTEGLANGDSGCMRLDSMVNPQICKSSPVTQKAASNDPTTQQPRHFEARNQEFAEDKTKIPSNANPLVVCELGNRPLLETPKQVNEEEEEEEEEEEIGQIPFDEEYLQQKFFLNGGNENLFDVSTFFNDL